MGKSKTKFGGTKPGDVEGQNLVMLRDRPGDVEVQTWCRGGTDLVPWRYRPGAVEVQTWCRGGTDQICKLLKILSLRMSQRLLDLL